MRLLVPKTQGSHAFMFFSLKRGLDLDEMPSEIISEPFGQEL